MQAHPVFNKISIDPYKQERLQTFMVSYGVYVIIPLNWVKVEEISTIQHYISTTITLLHRKTIYKDYFQNLC